MKGIRVFLALMLPALMATAEQTRDFAKERAARVRHPDYTLTFQLGPDSTTYTGTVTLAFELISADAPLSVDFAGSSVDAVQLNGHAVAGFAYDADQARLTLPKAALKPGRQELTISYTGLYGTNGLGLHRFVDPADGRTYLYTDFEPQDAHRAFPCFDQPDLKATFETTVKAPADWVVVTNTLALGSHMEEGLRVTRFKRSKRFSTYLYQLTAGPYASFHDPDFRYPLGIYCRQSLARFVDADRFFETTRRGFDFFENYFDYPYPFEKYDQIFCPEFNSGAMENVAAVTWNESDIFRTPPSQDELLGRDITLLHEMAHMWFGDLVTMAWWDDLWLNESFATYASHVAADSLFGEEAWAQARWWRLSAIGSDRLSTTHPVLADVPDVTTANAIFDAITYGKGFCVLRQLDFYLGGTYFRDGVRLYFRKNAWRNTTLHDFTSAMEESSGRPLEAYMQTWLGTTGVNTVAPAFTSEDGKITHAVLRQSPSAGNGILRDHALNLGLFYTDADGMTRLTKKIKVNARGEVTDLPALTGLEAPAFILPNPDQQAYLLSSLDDDALAFLKEGLHTVADPVIRLEVWDILGRMVRDGYWDPQEMIEMVSTELARETDDDVLGRLSYLLRSSLDDYAPPADVAGYADRAFAVAQQRVEAQPGSDEQRTWVWLYITAALRGSHRQAAYEVATGVRGFEGYTVSNDLRWGLLTGLMDRGFPITEADIQAMVAADPDNSKENLLELRASRPTAEVKKETWEALLAGKGHSMNELRRMANGFATKRNDALMKPYQQAYFDTLATLDKQQSWVFVSGFASILFPEYGGEDALAAAERFIARPETSDSLRKLIQGRVETLRRKLRVKANWGKGDRVQVTGAG